MKISEAKKIDLENELVHRLTVMRPKIKADVIYAADQGDFYRENFPFDAAMAEKMQNEDRISEIEKILANVTIISKSKSSKVRLGNTVTLQKEDGTIRTVTLVEDVEVDSLAGKISLNSPIGQSLHNQETGHKFTIAGNLWKIKKIS